MKDVVGQVWFSRNASNSEEENIVLTHISSCIVETKLKIIIIKNHNVDINKNIYVTCSLLYL